MKEEFTLFWNGIFSQWHACKFKVDGIEYNSAEQYMMYSKARLMGNTKYEELIMNTKHPREQKKLGREIPDFDIKEWNIIAKDKVFIANYAKFTQNSNLLAELMYTRGTTLVEASPYDKIWGIGLKEDDPRALDRNTWQGTNWLGDVLTKVRYYIGHEQLLYTVNFN